MTQYGFNEYTFQQSLARARAREAAELAAIAAGNGPAPSPDVGEMLHKMALDNLSKALAMA